MRLIRDRQKGDTIIEVLFAVTVFAMVAVGSLSIMNQGTGAAQRALEITLVRAQIDAQAEAIRYIHQAYVTAYEKGNIPNTGTAGQWREMTEIRKSPNPSKFGVVNGKCPALPTTEQVPFILNARKAVISEAPIEIDAPADQLLPPFSQVAYNDDSSVNKAYGMWVEAVPSTNTDGPGFVDFHIRACWDSPGSSVPVTLGTIVRLYEPR